MDIAKLARAEYKANNLAITWMDTNGLKRTDNLSPSAQENLLITLLASSPAEPGKKQERGALVAKNVRLYLNDAGELVLEVTLGPGISVHIALPAPHPTRLKELLSEDPKTWKGVPTH